MRDQRDQRNQEDHDLCRNIHDQNADINDKIITNLRDLSHTIRFLYEGKGSQKRILILLDEAGGCMTQRDLTGRLGIQPGSASEVIAKLERAGQIRRTPSDSDRRTAEIRLTESGRQSASEAVDQRLTRHQEMFSCLSDNEKSELLTLLEKITADWADRYRENRESREGREEQGPGGHSHAKHGHHRGAHAAHHGSGEEA